MISSVLDWLQNTFFCSLSIPKDHDLELMSQNGYNQEDRNTPFLFVCEHD